MGGGSNGREEVGASPPVVHGGLLRISLTDRCNLRCRYCMPSEGVAAIPVHHVVSLEELVSIASWLIRTTGIDRIKLTGGEPLVRRGVVDIVRRLTALEGVREVSATTNGSRLADLARALRAAGLERVNVSLDTLDEERFAHLTRGGRVEDTLAGIEAASIAGLRPIKLNSVLLASTFRDDVPALLDLAGEWDLEIRFIELMRTGTKASWAEGEFVAADEVRRWLVGVGSIEGAADDSGAARHETIRWRGGALQVGWITPRSRPFCVSCDRLRLDARGGLRRCLMDPEVLPLAELLRNGDGSRASTRVEQFLNAKQPPAVMDSELPMASVGG